MSGDPGSGGKLARQRRQTAAETSDAAKAIIEAETSARDKKTAKLRALRLAKEAEAPPPEPAKKKARKASATKGASK